MSQSSSAMARRAASSLIETHSKVVDREERRKERAAAVVSVNAFFGFVEMLTEQVNVQTCAEDTARRNGVPAR